MPDGYERLTIPAGGGASVTPSDTATLTIPSRCICVGVAGNVRVDMVDGSTVTWPALAAGVLHPIRARRIYASGTTATTIVVGY